MGGELQAPAHLTWRISGQEIQKITTWLRQDIVGSLWSFARSDRQRVHWCGCATDSMREWAQPPTQLGHFVQGDWTPSQHNQCHTYQFEDEGMAPNSRPKTLNKRQIFRACCPMHHALAGLHRSNETCERSSLHRSMSDCERSDRERSEGDRSRYI